MNTRTRKQVTALALLSLGAVLVLATGSGPADAASRLDPEKPYCIIVYQSCLTLQPTGRLRYDFCDGHTQYLGSGQRTECYVEQWQGDCL